MEQLEQLYMEMIRLDAGDPKRIQHFVKVHSFARLIGIAEGLKAKEMKILEAAAYMHDIGIHKAEELYGRCDGKLQEELGPDIAREMLETLHFGGDEIERVCYLIGHHHTYHAIDGLDYQILVEADFLVNLYEDGADGETVRQAVERIFRTKTGRKLAEEMFQI